MSKRVLSPLVAAAPGPQFIACQTCSRESKWESFDAVSGKHVYSCARCNSDFSVYRGTANSLERVLATKEDPLVTKERIMKEIDANFKRRIEDAGHIK